MSAAVETVNLPTRLDEAVRGALADTELPVVVAGPGMQAVGRFLDLTQTQWDVAMVDAALAFRTAQSAVRSWLADGSPGRVVFAVSTASLRAVQGAALAATAGGFLTTIGQVGAAELGGKGITVNTVAYGWLEGASERLAEGIPIGRLARPGEVASAIAFLASPAASYVNGAVLAVDGGFWITKTGGGSPLLG